MKNISFVSLRMTKLSPQQITSFQKEILDWFEKNKRDLPWRDVPVTHDMRSGTSLRDPYPILVSEVMLQQTQVPRVIPKFEAWMKKFPTVESLAKVSTRNVLAAWSGLGYNRRALFLKKAAEQLVNSSEFRVQSKSPSPQTSPTRGEGDQGVLFPRTEKELRKLPGIGIYTARAILCFAFNQQISVVDTNVRKVILTFLTRKALSVKGKDNVIPAKAGIQKKPWIPGQARDDNKKIMTEKEIQEVANQLLPKGKAYEWNQALMDYSSAMLKKEKSPIPKQSHFKTSNRFYRGQVIKLLLKKDKQTVSWLFAQLENNGITKEKFEEILQQMEKDGLVVYKKYIYSLPL